MRKLLVVLALSVSVGAWAQSYQPLLQPHVHFVDGSGSPCSGCSLFSYMAGSTTPQATYTDSSGGSLNTNPVVLDASGSASIWVGSSAYKFTLVDASGTTLWTVDNVTSSLPIGGGTLTGALTGTTASFPGGVTAPVTGHASLDLPLTGGTLTGGLTVPKLGPTIFVDQEAGSSADVKLNKCFSDLGTNGGICDARGFGATVQTIAATVVNTSGAPVTLIFDPSTKFEPSTTSVQMFHFNRGIQVWGSLHIDLIDSSFSTTYTGTAVLVDDIVTVPDLFVLSGLNCDNRNLATNPTPAGGSTCLKVNSTDASHYQVGMHIQNLRCANFDTCVNLTAATGGFINTDFFTSLDLYNCISCVSLNATTTTNSGPITANVFTNLFIQTAAWTTSPIIGTGAVIANKFQGGAIWDTPGAYDVDWVGGNAFNPSGNDINLYVAKGVQDGSPNSTNPNTWDTSAQPTLNNQTTRQVASTAATQFEVGQPVATAGGAKVVNIYGTPGSNIINFQGVQNGVGFNQALVFQPSGAGVWIGTTTDCTYKLCLGGDVSTTGLYRINGNQIASSNLSDSASIVKHCGESTFTAATSGTAVTCSQVTVASHCSASWQGTPGAGILGVTAGAGTVAVSASASSTGTASVFCSIN